MEYLQAQGWTIQLMQSNESPTLGKWWATAYPTGRDYAGSRCLASRTDEATARAAAAAFFASKPAWAVRADAEWADWDAYVSRRRR